MRNYSIKQLPVVDADGRPLSLEVMESLIDRFSKHEAIVMAGGMGARLRPLTQTTPKPLLSVAGRPILDHILSGLRDSGLHDIVISVNYMADHIKKHVKDGHSHKLNVSYLNEHDRLGTAGALFLLQPRPKRPFLVTNGDLLTSINYAKLLHFQEAHDYDIVMCIKVQETTIPYGVVEIKADKVVSIKEKPVYRHFINAGIYVLKPQCIDLIPANSYFDMTNLIDKVIRKNGRIGAFPVIEYWRDIGTPADLSTASKEQREAMFRKNNQVEETEEIAAAV
jgi:NDP-sugar pyrophosphorylase family protein